jgi:hypothetical protein
MTYELIEEEEPDRNPLQKVGRQVGKAAAAGVGGFVGGVGDLANLASVGLEKVGAISPEGGKEFRDRTLTSGKIKEGFQEQFPSLKPENKIERFSDDVFETIGSLGTGGPGKTAAFKLLRKFGLSLGANLGKEVVDQVASEENSKASQYTKTGILFLGSLINPKLAASEAAKKYSQAEKLLPQGANVSSTKVINQLNTIENGITKGRPKSSLSNAELFVIDKIDKARNLDQNGRIDINQLVAQKKSLNEDLGNLFPEFGQAGTKSVRNQAKRVNRALNEAIDEYGASNPEYLKNLRAADEIYATMAKAEGFGDWVRQNFPHSPWSRAGLLFVEKSLGQVPKILYKAWKSPEIRNLYVKAIGKAASEDAKEFAKVMDQLDKKLIEEESKEHWESID